MKKYPCVRIAVAAAILAILPNWPAANEYKTNYFGNTWDGDDTASGDRRAMMIGPSDVCVIPTSASGNVVVAGHFSEGVPKTIRLNPNGGFRNDFHTSGGRNDKGWAVATDGSYVYKGGDRAIGGVEKVGVYRYNFNGSDADWTDRSTNFTPLYDRYDSDEYAVDLPSGIALHDGEMFVSDPINNEIRVFDSSTGFEKTNRSILVTSPLELVVDDDAFLWVVSLRNSGSYEIRKYSRGSGNSTAGSYQNKRILSPNASTPWRPKGLAIDNSGRLLVADSGEFQQVIRYSRLDTTPRKDSWTLGRKFGVWAGSNRGRVADSGNVKFCFPIGVAVAPNGDIYVATDGQGGKEGRNRRSLDVAPNGKLYRFDQNKNLQWVRYGMEWVSSADIHPRNDKIAYSVNHKYELDYSAATGNGWSHTAFTIDPWNYPHDARILPENRLTSSADIVRFSGKNFLLVRGQSGSSMFLYRFDGDIAVPAVAWIDTGADYPVRDGRNSASTRIALGKDWRTDWPPNAPPEISDVGYMWIDENGDGQMDEEEYYETPWGDGERRLRALNLQTNQFETSDYQEFRGVSAALVDSDGTIWISEGNSDRPNTERPRIHRLPLHGLSASGVPLYRPDQDHSVRNIPGNGLTGSARNILQSVSVIDFDAENNRLYALGFSRLRPKFVTTSDPESPLNQVAGGNGTELWAFDNWPSNSAAVVPGYPIVPETQFDGVGSEQERNDRVPFSFDQEGDFIFLAYQGNSRQDPNEGTSTGGLLDYRNGEVKVHSVSTQEEVANFFVPAPIRMGYQDVIYSVSASKLSDGNYTVIVEDDAFCKLVYHHWRPRQLIQNDFTNRYLNQQGSSQSWNVRTLTGTGNSSKWFLEPFATTRYRIRANNGTRPMTSLGSGTGWDVRTSSASTSNNSSQWRLINAGGGKFQIENRANGRYLKDSNSNGNDVVTIPPPTTTDQSTVWDLTD